MFTSGQITLLEIQLLNQSRPMRSLQLTALFFVKCKKTKMFIKCKKCSVNQLDDESFISNYMSIRTQLHDLE